MAQFDVHRNLGRLAAQIPYVVIVQSRRFDASLGRVVLPLIEWLELGGTESRG